MVRHFFLDKTATLIKDSRMNTGLNPVMELNYGNGISRGILHFDETELLALVKDKTFADIDKLSVSLKMTNCASVDGLPYEKNISHDSNTTIQRAASFDIIAFKLPQDFDEGRGFDFVADFWINNNRSFNTNAANWYFSQNGRVWVDDDDKIDLSNPNLNMKDGNFYILSGETKNKLYLDGGVYTVASMEKEMKKYESGEESVIIGSQHFDFGHENLNICITDYVKSLINGSHNYGIGLMFAPSFEKTEMSLRQYVGFFTDHTNTFFHPYIEVVYDEPIADDRATFALGKENRLYLYANIGGEPQNLDSLPVCSIDEKEYPVKQAQKGVYYALISPSEPQMDRNTIYYDKWSNLALNGKEIEPVEMEFSTHNNFIKIGSESAFKDMMVPSVYGIDFDEKLHRGETREITVDFRKKYTTDKKELIDGAEYTLYIKDGNRSLTVIGYTPVEKAYLNNFFLIHTADLIPHEYFVDIKVKKGRETRFYKEILRFKVVSNVTERYE